MTDPARTRVRGGALLVVTAVAIGAAVTFGGEPAVDDTIVREASAWRDGAVGRLMEAASDVGYARWLIPAAALWSVLLGVVWRRWRDGLVVAFATPLAAVVTRLLKESFERARPEGGVDPLVAGFSMPSGHATSSAAFVVSVVLATHPGPRRTALLVVGIAFALLVMTSRVVLGVHYPSDVIAGLCSGTGMALLVAGFVTRVLPRAATL